MSVELLDGTTDNYSLRPQEAVVSELRSRVGSRVGVPASSVKLACDGFLLSDDRASLSNVSNATAWVARSARVRSEHAQQSMPRKVDVVASARAWYPWLASTARAIAAAARRAPPMAWLRLTTWAILFFGAKYVGLTGPFLLVSAVHLVYLFGFSERAPGEESAYTVFNNMRALPGQLMAEDLERDLVRGL